MNVSVETLQRLTEVGYLACGHQLDGLAQQIFDGVAALRPDSDAPAIGRGLAALCRGDAGLAVELLQAARDAHPESDAVRSFLGLALKLAGLNQQSETILREVASAGRDPQAAAMAHAILHPSDE